MAGLACRDGSGPPLKTRRFAQTLGLGIFLVAYGTNVSTPLLVAYRDRLSLGDSATMSIFTVYVSGILLMLPFAGQLSDRFGRKRISVPFVIVSALASLIMILGENSFIFLLLGRFLLGIVSGSVLSIGSAWMQEILGAGHEQKAALVATVLSYGGFGLGPPISALIFEVGAAPLQLPYLIHIVATLLVVPLILRLPESTQRSSEPIRLQLGIPANGQRLFRRRIAPAAIWVYCFPSTAFALFPVIISDAVDGSPVVVAGVSAAFTAWAALVARPILPRIGVERALELGMLLGSVGYVCGTTSFITDLWWLVLPAAFLLGAASGLLTGGSLALLNQIADDASRGSINATFFLLAYPGMTMPIVLTAVGSIIGLTNALVVVTLLAVLCTAVLIRRHDGELSASPVVPR